MNKFFSELSTLYSREKFLVISNVAIITVTFILLGLFMSLGVGMQTAIKSLEEQAQITLFFKDSFLEDQIISLKGTLEADERIAEVSYISKEDAFNIFTEINKDEPVLLEAISKDILPASLEIKAEKVVFLSDLATEFESLESVEEVKFFESVVERFKSWASTVYIVGGVLVGVFLLLSFAIIFATLRINISHKAEEIEILKLVGAPNAFIRSPFLIQGVSFGIISAVIASIIISILFTSVHFFGFFTASSLVVLIAGFKVAIWVFWLILVGLMLLFGLLLGYFGSFAAVKKYLKY
jgi:cell division transport system permease protein